jgi:phenylacetic acid degradation operon negative regulatory protein
MHMRAEPSRTWSLIVTLFGDVVVPRGGRLWLGTALEIFEALHIGGNVVRTAMSRLTADGWLERNRVGRNSYYRLAEKGRVISGEAAVRIYGATPQAWDGRFRMAVLGSSDSDVTRSALEAAGYVQLAPGVLIALSEQANLATPSDMVMMRSETDADGARRLADRVWPTHRLGERYRRFVKAFQPLAAHLASGNALSDLEALLGRLLLIHEYRRLALRDPMLPEALLPEDWPGREARSLCAGLYRALLEASERWLDDRALNEDGRLPPPMSSLTARFHD